MNNMYHYKFFCMKNVFTLKCFVFTITVNNASNHENAKFFKKHSYFKNALHRINNMKLLFHIEIKIHYTFYGWKNFHSN